MRRQVSARTEAANLFCGILTPLRRSLGAYPARHSKPVSLILLSKPSCSSEASQVRQAEGKLSKTATCPHPYSLWLNSLWLMTCLQNLLKVNLFFVAS